MTKRRRWISRLGLPALLLAPVGAPATETDAPAAPAIEVVRRARPELPILVRGECWRPWKGQLAFGRPIMSLRDRRSYRVGQNKQQGCEAEQAYWLEHVEAMQLRALEMGVSLPEPPRAPGTNQRVFVEPYARHLMPLEEREEWQKQYGALETRAERRAFEAAHVEKMRERAQSWSMTLPPPRTEEEEQAQAEAAQKALERRAWSEAMSTIRANQEDPDRKRRKRPRTKTLFGR